MNRKILMAAIILMLLSAILAGAFHTKAVSKTIVVPDDYPTIQAAVNNATMGDTIFVKKGTYNETVEITKPLSLIGENRSSTVVVGLRLSYGQPPAVITIDRSISNVTVSGLTLTGDSNAGMWINEGARNCTVTDNIVTDNSLGIQTFEGIDPATGLGEPAGILISNNYITNNSGFGVLCATPNTTISGNTILDNDNAGIIVDSSFDVTISGNTIKGNGVSGDPNLAGGLYLRWWGPFNVYGNTITDNHGYGIQFGEGCNNSTVHENSIEGNVVGVNVQNFIAGGDANIGRGNYVYQNNLVNNSQQAIVEKTNFVASGDATLINGTDVVSWDNGKEGNYWSDYTTRYSDASEIGSTGIGNTPYVIDANNVDHYPLMKLIAVPEFPSGVIMAALCTATVALAVLLKRKKPTRNVDPQHLF